MPGIPLEYYAPVFALFLLLLAVAFVPRERYKELFWFGLIWGYLAGTVTVYILATVFNLFYYVRIMPFIMFGSPLWLTFAWIPTIMLYLHFLPDRKEWYVFPLYLATFSVASMEIDGIFNRSGLLLYNHWTPFYRFLLALGWFYLAAFHYRRLYPQGNRERRKKS